MKKSLVAVAFAGLAAAILSHAALADGGAKFLGNITTNGAVREDFGKYWNQITAENECKWGSINTAEDVYQWEGCDRAYNWAKKNNAHFKFHALLWGSQFPNWIRNLDAKKTKEIIEKWMKAVADHYEPMGGLEMIDVVNEAIYNGGYHSRYTDTKIIDALGGDLVVNGKHTYTFVAEAFKMARKYFPNSILIYNDYNTIRWQIDEGINLVQQIIKQGAPVDAYGQQAHDISGMGKDDFAKALTKIHDAVGIPLYITEYDVGSDDDSWQKASYEAQIPFLWETPWIAGITLWGYITGATWINVDAKKAGDCTGTWEVCNASDGPNGCKGCSGLITNGSDRLAMTWLKEYFAKNLEKGKNDGFAAIEPVPQTPFGGKPWPIPGKIEAENFDVPGVGVGNNSYYDSDASINACADDYEKKDAECTDYRKDTGVDVKNGASGKVVGWNASDEWMEYTVDVAATGTYTLYAAVSAAGSTSSFKLSIDGEDITKELVVPAATAGEDNYGEFNKVKAIVNLEAGKHILRLSVVGPWFDIDYINFEAGENAPDSNPLDPAAIKPVVQEVHLQSNVLDDFDVFDMQGIRMGRLSAYGVDQAVATIKSSNILKNQGVYYVRNKRTGMMQSIHITK
ncbi:endo-1,4-beta-xylanase [Fibrobacter sp.]|uniref:endo-1,4-beta-xylanase n=1 Tax=Fibrobacter sp. TaxID=35828 RepID=UPI00388FAC2C